MDGDDEHDNARGWEVVAPAPEARPSASDKPYGDEFSVFPPSLHEGLTPTLTLDSPSSSADGLEESKDEENEEAEEEWRVSRPRVAETARRLVESGIELVRSKIAGLGGGGGGCYSNGGAVWSFAAVAGFAGVLMFMRRRHRRERELLLFMILEKDERINQLMDQIVKMSEVIITTNYKVPVVTRT